MRRMPRTPKEHDRRTAQSPQAHVAALQDMLSQIKPPDLNNRSVEEQKEDLQGASASLGPGQGLLNDEVEETGMSDQSLGSEDEEGNDEDGDFEDGGEEDGDEESAEENSANESTDSDIQDPKPGELIKMDHFLGDWHEKHTKKLYAIAPMEAPPQMTVTPQPHQLKAASQADFLCKSKFKGMLLGDGKGLETTLTAILAMWLERDRPGVSVVVVHKTLAHQWLEQIEGSFEPGHGLKALLLEKASTMTAHELIATGADVVVVDYEQVSCTGKERAKLVQNVEDDINGKQDKPKGPNAVLHSSIWRELGVPIKRLVLDEAHIVNKRSDVRHKAIKELDADGTIVISGTLDHGCWVNISGYLDFLKGHPFTTHKEFMDIFSTWPDNVPDLQRQLLLQKFLQGFTIIRPESIIGPERCHGVSYTSALVEQEAEVSAEIFRPLIRLPDEGPSEITLRRVYQTHELQFDHYQHLVEMDESDDSSSGSGMDVDVDTC